MKTVLALLLIPCGLQATTIYRSTLLPDNVVPKEDGLSPAGISSAWAEARFELDLRPWVIEMSYEITFHNITLDEITGVHFHFGHDPSFIPVSALSIFTPSIAGPTLNHEGAAGPNGPHLLNVFKAPREDDADLKVDSINNKISGVWDNSDFNFGPDGIREPGDSVALGSVIEIIEAEEVYIQVHSMNFPAPNTGELRGQVILAPEPGTSLLIILAGTGCLIRRRRGLAMDEST